MTQTPRGEALIGRERELRTLVGSYRDAAADRACRALLLHGPLGIGKTALATAGLAQVHGSGGRAVLAACLPTSAVGIQGWPLQALLGQLIPDRALVADPASRAVDLQQAAQSGPLLIVWDDLQWADAVTTEVFAWLLQAARSAPLLMVGCLRTGMGEDWPAWAQEIERLDHVAVEELAPFDRRATAALLQREAAEPTSTAIEWVFRGSGGNPLVATELVRACVSGQPGGWTGADALVRLGREGAGAALPATLARRLGAAPGRFSVAAQRILAVIATAGDSGIEHDLLVAVLEQESESVTTPADTALEAGLRECVDAGIVESGRLGEGVTAADGYRFRIGAQGWAISEGLLPGERRALHRRLAEVMSAPGRSVPASRLARHWLLAGRWPEALAASVEAARRARQNRAYDEALTMLTTAVELQDLVVDAPEVTGCSAVALIEQAAEAAHLAGADDRARQLIEAAAERLRISDPVADIRLLGHQLVRYLCAEGATDRALAAATATMPAERPVHPDAEWTQADARRATAHAEALRVAGRLAESGAAAEAALELARAAGDLVEESVALGILGFDQAQLGDHESGLASLEQAVEMAERSADPDAIGRSHLALAELLGGPLNRTDQAMAAADAGLARCADLGLDRSYGAALRAIAINTRFRCGAWGDTEKLIEEGFASGPSGVPAVELRLARARLSVARGQFDLARQDLSALEALLEGAAGPRYRGPLLTLEAGLALWEGRPLDARTAIRQGLAHAAESDDVWSTAPMVWHGVRAEADIAEQVAGRRGEWAGRDAAAVTSEARLMAERLTEHAHTLARESARSASTPVQQLTKGYAALCKAELSRTGEASDPDLWATAGEHWRALGQPYPTAYCRWQQAAALLAVRARSGDAATALREARRVAVELGARPFLAEIERLAADARIDLPDSSGPGCDNDVPMVEPEAIPPELKGLTRRELDVLRLVAQGHTNRQIGERLYISEKTVSVHVSHVLAKLGLKTRVQATRLARHLGMDAQDLGAAS